MNIIGVLIGFVLLVFGFINAMEDRMIWAAVDILIGCANLTIYGSRLLDGDDE